MNKNTNCSRGHMGSFTTPEGIFKVSPLISEVFDRNTGHRIKRRMLLNGCSVDSTRQYFHAQRAVFDNTASAKDLYKLLHR